MKFAVNQKIIALFITIFFSLFAFACQKDAASGGAATPTDAYKQLFAAVKAKNPDDVKKMMSKASLNLAQMNADRQKITLEKSLENGLTSTTFSPSLPPIRDERIKDNYGEIEVWNSSESKWNEVSFVNENGWKLAFGDQFSGTYKKPGKGRSEIEAEANPAVNKMTIMPSSNIPPMNNANSAAPPKTANVNK